MDPVSQIGIVPPHFMENAGRWLGIQTLKDATEDQDFYSSSPRPSVQISSRNPSSRAEPLFL